MINIVGGNAYFKNNKNEYKPIVYDQNFFDKELMSYEIKSTKSFFESIGGICNGNEMDCSKIKDIIDIRLFYNLTNELRAKLLKHILGSKCSAWSLDMMEERNKTPVYMCSYHPYPRTYELVYIMDDKSNDVVIKEVLVNLKKELDLFNSQKETEIKSNKDESDKVKSTKTIKAKKTQKSLQTEINLDKVESDKKDEPDKKDELDKKVKSKAKKTQKTEQIEINSEKTDKKRKKTIPPSLKIKIWNKYIGDEIGKSKCLCCKIQDIYQASFSCGHITSEHNGGKIVLDNLKPICSSCNSSMGTKNMDEYIAEFGF